VLEDEVAKAAEEIFRNLSLEKKALPKKHEEKENVLKTGYT